MGMSDGSCQAPTESYDHRKFTRANQRAPNEGRTPGCRKLNVSNKRLSQSLAGRSAIGQIAETALMSTKLGENG
eukprot:scaffold2113_cov233-Pinguiococcus_pyrenoidosus.AAC.5